MASPKTPDEKKKSPAVKSLEREKRRQKHEADVREEELDEGLEDTVRWYVDNYAWVEGIRTRGFHSDRLGLVKA